MRKLLAIFAAVALAVATYVACFAWVWSRYPSQIQDNKGRKYRVVRAVPNSWNERIDAIWAPAIWYVENIRGYRFWGFEGDTEIYYKEIPAQRH